MFLKKAILLCSLSLYVYAIYGQVPGEYLTFDSLILARNTAAAEVLAVDFASSTDTTQTDFGLSSMMLGRLALSKKSWSEADSLFRLADEALVRIGKTETDCYSMVLTQRGFFMHIRKRYDEGVKLYQKNLALQNRLLGPNNIETLRTRFYLGLIHLDAGKLANSEYFYLEAIQAFEAAQKTNTLEYIRSLIGYGTVLGMEGKSYLAIKSLEKAMEFAQIQFGKPSYFYTKALFEYSSLLMMIGQIEEAESTLREVVTLSKSLYEQKKANEYCSGMINLGEVYNLLAQYEKAAQILTVAVSEVEKTYGFASFRYQYATYNLGIVCTHLGKPEDAEKYLGLSATSALQASGPNSDRYQAAQSALILLAIKNNHIETARRLIDSISIDINGYSGYTIRSSQGVMTQALGSWYQYIGQYEKALACFDSILVWCLEDGMKFTNYRYHALIDRKNILLASGRLPEAIESLRQASVLHKTIFERQASVLTDAERQNLADEFLSELSTFSHLYSISPSVEMASEMADLFIFSQNLFETTTRRTQKFFQNTSDTTIINLYDQWLITREKLRESYETLAPEGTEAFSNLKNLELETENQEKMLVVLGVPIALKEKSPSWTGLRNALTEEEAAVAICRTFSFDGKELVDKPVYLACIIRKDAAQPEYVYWENGMDLESFIAGQYQNEITQKKDLSTNLYEKMWAPVATHLKGVKTVYFSPDGIFHKINLNTLRAADGTYVLDNIQIKQVTNLRNLLDRGLEAAGSEPGMAVMFGNPAFKTGANSVSSSTPADLTARTPLYRDIAEDAKGDLLLPPLPGSEREVNAIAKKLTGKNWQTSMFTGAKATEDTLKQLKSPKVLHIATHGYFLNSEKTTSPAGLTLTHAGRNPDLRSMLFFAGAENSIAGENSGRNDGILTAFEAAVLNLDKTELVVLSACNTGLGKIQNGEGVFGLQRAFRIAGAKSLIMSLWEVEDAATELLMNAFYENWLSGMSKSEAFCKAQLSLKAKYPQPFYWGSFILVNG